MNMASKRKTYSSFTEMQKSLEQAFAEGTASPNAPGAPVTAAEPKQVPSTQSPERPVNGNPCGNT
jgi:hypothetical protein